MSPRIGLLQVCAAGILWGTGGLVVQLIRERVPMSTLTISAYRMLIAAVALLVLMALLRRWPEVRSLVLNRPGAVAVVGTLTGAYQALYFASVIWVGVTVATVVSLGFAPVLLTVVDSIRTRRMPPPPELLVVGTALAGLALVSTSSGLGATGPHPVLGVAAALASGATYALATTLGRPLAQRTDPLVLVTAATFWGAVALIPLGLLGAIGDPPLVTTDPPTLAGLAYLGVATMALAYGLLYAGLRLTAPSAAVIATLLEPVAAAILAATILDEELAALGIVGTALILAAVAGLGRQGLGRQGAGRRPLLEPPG